MESSRNDLVVYTIGHSNVSEETLVKLLQNFEIRVVVDVRSVPYSQYTPQFNGPVFERTLQNAGIHYIFAGAWLGGRPDDPRYYKREILPGVKVNYLQEVNYEEYAKNEQYLKGIRALLRRAEESRTAIMCSEEDPQRCHRHHLITQITLLPMGVHVHHIRGNGEIEHAEPEAKQASLF